MTKVIEVTVAPNGETRVETKGFAGNECQQASLFVEAALGNRISEQRTSEYHSGVLASEKQQQRT